MTDLLIRLIDLFFWWSFVFTPWFQNKAIEFWIPTCQYSRLCWPKWLNTTTLRSPLALMVPLATHVYVPTCRSFLWLLSCSVSFNLSLPIFPDHLLFFWMLPTLTQVHSFHFYSLVIPWASNLLTTWWLPVPILFLGNCLLRHFS